MAEAELRAIAETLMATSSDLARGGTLAFRATLRPSSAAVDAGWLPRLSPAPAGTAAARVPGREQTDLSLRALLGSGGMGEVWLADQASLSRSVAIKVDRSPYEPYPGW